MMTTTESARGSTLEEIAVPGNYDYGTRFMFDWNVVDSGTYRYGVEESKTRRLGGTRLGYELFYTLWLDFKMKDGREYHEIIDMLPLIKELVKTHDIPDVSKTKWGGSATINIKITDDDLVLEYEVTERIIEPRYKLKNQYFPMFKKALD